MGLLGMLCLKLAPQCGLLVGILLESLGAAQEALSLTGVRHRRLRFLAGVWRRRLHVWQVGGAGGFRACVGAVLSFVVVRSSSAIQCLALPDQVSLQKCAQVPLRSRRPCSLCSTDEALERKK